MMRHRCITAGSALAAILLLQGVDLVARAQDVAGPPPPATAPTVLPPVTVVGVSPLIGSGIDRNTVPAETQVLNADDLRRQGTPDLANALNQQVGGSLVSIPASGNPFQPTFFYHGFAASPLQGTPQGLAVYVNGVASTSRSATRWTGT